MIFSFFFFPEYNTEMYCILFFERIAKETEMNIYRIIIGRFETKVKNQSSQLTISFFFLHGIRPFRSPSFIQYNDLYSNEK